ncbi:MAG: undecaprenyl-phosphate glucose phosphotransferase [Lysobacteraceae bacterium]|nr:MAG: undecaprenyl-phosphate glucose phosphotransferase [Xanthomonadaceae bacterium]
MPYTKYTALFSLGLRFADLAGLLAAGVFAYWLRFGTPQVDLEYQRNLGRGLLFALVVFSMTPLYRSWRGRGLASELWTMLGAYLAIFVVAVLYTVAFKLSSEISRLWWATWFAGAVVTGTGARLLCRATAAWTRQLGFDLRSAVIVGGGHDAQRIVRALERQPWAGIQVKGWFETHDSPSAALESPRLGGLAQLAGYVQQHGIQQVWVALPMGAQAEIEAILEALAHSTADIKFVPDLLGLQLLNQSVEQVAGLPVINLRSSPLDGQAHLLKAIEDRLLAALILVLIAPLMAVIALAVKLSSPGPVLFRQARHGIDGQIIQVWKFRSMRVHQEGGGRVTQATQGDPRVTPLGRFLRRTSLDELPQFFNVLQGTMSIVGPRPHALAHNHQYMDIVDNYMQRHRVKPGITGWAQVNGLRGETDTLEKMAARVEYDLYYMQHWSLALDLKIIAMTVIKGFLGKNAY